MPEAEIQPAKAVTAMFDNIAEFLGPALGTALVLGIGTGAAFAIDAATFLLSAVLLTRVPPRARSAPAAGAPRDPVLRGKVWAEARAGLREVRSRTWVWVTLAAFCVALFAGLAPWFVLGPGVGRQQYWSIAVFGVVASAVGAGTVIGSVVGIPGARGTRCDWRCWGSCSGRSSILYADGVALAIVIPATVVAGTGIALFDVWWERRWPSACRRTCSPG